jgi:hypothetical protein
VFFPSSQNPKFQKSRIKNRKKSGRGRERGEEEKEGSIVGVGLTECEQVVSKFSPTEQTSNSRLEYRVPLYLGCGDFNPYTIRYNT